MSCILTTMRKPKKDEIPVSKISHTTVYADFSGVDGDGKILYLNPKCVLVGLDGVPYMLFITADFNQDDLTKTIGGELYQVKRLVLQHTFSYVSPEKRSYCKIPDWLLAFKKIEWLKFKYVELDELWLFRNLPVQHLVLQNVRFNDPTIFADSIIQFNLLNQITHDNCLNKELISKIASALPHVKFSYETE
ncbi:hypothetical protein Mucpa_6345 [Mucilaginibacter paludis DSM 18603]|uniref:Uncharacterized protein n=2 Tax=Mucilaginibacter TaxID=423349 RepID=H1Y5X9_9SPHI|nr:hypothetical protein Mucpa_6345 [Mucilaginibacter paludis DSM 18603]